MSVGQAQYFYTIELTALQEQLNQLMEKVGSVHAKAVKRQDEAAADRIARLQQAIDLAQNELIGLQ